MSRPTSVRPSSAPTPVPSSPPPSESYLSELDGTAPSVLDTSVDFAWDAGAADASVLNLVSWKLDVNARAEDGVDRRGFNGESSWFAPMDLADLRSHLHRVEPPYEEGKPSTLQSKTLTPAGEPAAEPAQTSSTIRASSSSSTVPLTGEYDSRPPSTRKADLPPLDSVPELFFDTSFNLANPSTWAELVHDAGPSSPRDTPGQDALSTHLDTLERHLVHEITLRSTSFFSALSNLQDLHSESASCLSRISELQSSLSEVGSKQARKGLDIIDAQEKLRVLRMTEDGVRTMGELEEMLRIARSVVDHGDWAAGLGCLEDVVRWWELHGDLDTGHVNGDEPSSSLPLSTLPALSALPKAFDELTHAIAEQLEASLSTLLLSILSSAEPDVVIDNDDVQSSVEPILVGLVRCGHVDGLGGLWKEVVTVAVREGSRKHLPVAPTDDGDVEGRAGPEMRGANLASALQAMDHSRFLLLSTQMYSTLLARLRLAQTMSELLNETLRCIGSTPPLRISSELESAKNPIPGPAPLAIDVSETVASACELANLRASKILAVRSEQHAGLQLTEFVEIFKENWEFVMATETLSNRMIVSLRGVTASQARTFLIAYHSFRLTRSAKLVEEEQWTQIDVSHPVQHVVELLIESAVKDPAECFVPTPPTESNGDASSSKTLDIEDKHFFVVKATAESLILLGDYLKIVINLELVVTDVMGRIIEFLKSFNSRTCQVVLGAGAMRSAGLKNITAKHLALASQSLSVIVSLIPYIREFIRRHLSAKQAVMLTEFDKLKRDYQEHQNEIHAKLVAIMSDRLSVHVGSLREIDWEAAPAKDGPRPYAEMLVKETATLHKVLSKYLAPQTVESVMSEVLAAIVHRLSDEYAKIELKSDDAKKRMTQDVALVAAKLVPLAEAGKNVASLETLVKDKPLPRKPMGQAVAGFLKRGNSKDESKVAAGADETGVAGDKEAEDEGEDEDGESLGVIPDQVGAEAQPEPPTGDKAHGHIDEAPAAPAVEAPTPAPAAPPAVEVPTPAEDAPTTDIRDPSPPSPIPSAPAVPERVPSPAAPERITSPPIPERLTSPGIPERIASPIPIIRSSLERLRSPSPGPQSPFTERITSPMSSPSPAGFGSPTGRAPRVSLANRLRGVVTRAGSEPRDELMSPPPPPKDVVQELPPPGVVSPSEPIANGGTSGQPQQSTTEVKESEKDGEASVLAVNGVEPAASQPLFEAPLDDLASPAPPPPEKDMPAKDESDVATKPDPTETELTGTQPEHEGEGSAVPGSAEPQVTSHETEQEAQSSAPNEDGGEA